MPKLQIKATELVDANVDFVSLVKRGANRLPFRITKGDEPMLDLHKISRSLFSKAENTPEITAAVVPVGTDTAQLATVFKDAGLDTKVFLKKEIDGVVTLAKADADKAEDTVIIKTGDKIGLVVSGLKKAFDAYTGSSDFVAAVKAQSFYPSFATAREVMNDCVHVALHKSGSPAEAAESISKTVEDFQSYVTMLAGSLPASAFYVDRHYTELGKADTHDTTETPDEPAAGDVAKADDKDGDKKDKEKDEANSDADAGDKKEGDKASAQKAEEEADAGASTSEPTSKEDNAELIALKKSQEDMMSALAELQKTVTAAVSGLKDDVKKDLAGVNDRISKVAEQAQKTDAALNGTVFGEAGDDQLRVEKSEVDDSAPPLLDTAYHRIEAA